MLAAVLTLAMTAQSLPPLPERALLYFHADWCGPCRTATPGVAQFYATGRRTYSVDVDHRRDLVARYGVRRVPTFVVIDPSWREVSRLEGLPPGDLGGQLINLYDREASP